MDPSDSSAEDTDLASGQVETTGDKSSMESPAAGDGDVKKPETLLDRFEKRSLRRDRQGQSSGSEGNQDGSKDPNNPDADGEKPEDKDEDDPNASAEDIKSRKLRTKRRIEELLGENKQLKEEAAGMRSKAKGFDRVSKFVQEAGLSRDEVNQGFEIMRLMKHDPIKAMEALRPYWDQLLSAGGNVLPDLQQKVDAGEISEEVAQELSQRRAQAAIQEAQLGQQQSQFSQQEHLRSVSNVAGAVTTWENQWKQTDPDYKALQPYVMQEIELTLRRIQEKASAGDQQAAAMFPRNPQMAIDLCEKIKTEVLARLNKFRGNRPAVNPPNTAGTKPGAMPKPKTMAEVIDRTLAAGR